MTRGKIYFGISFFAHVMFTHSQNNIFVGHLMVKMVDKEWTCLFH